MTLTKLLIMMMIMITIGSKLHQNIVDIGEKVKTSRYASSFSCFFVEIGIVVVANLMRISASKNNKL